jgi:hypothetical protein
MLRNDLLDRPALSRRMSRFALVVAAALMAWAAWKLYADWLGVKDTEARARAVTTAATQPRSASNSGAAQQVDRGAVEASRLIHSEWPRWLLSLERCAQPRGRLVSIQINTLQGQLVAQHASPDPQGSGDLVKCLNAGLEPGAPRAVLSEVRVENKEGTKNFLGRVVWNEGP